MHTNPHSIQTKLKISLAVKLKMAELKLLNVSVGRQRIPEKSGIYKITSPNGDVYIGQSVKLHKRLRDFKYSAFKNWKMQNSINKYGWENHIKKIIHELPSDVSQTVLDAYEVIYMQAYIDCGVNLLNIKEGGKNGKLGKETVALLRARRHKPESIQKMRDAKIGHTNTPFKKIICSKTGIIYNGTKDAANSLGVNVSVIISQINGFTKNKLNIKYII